MATVRLVGIDPATGKEHTLTTGDVIENFGGIVAGMTFKGAIPDVGSFPAEVSREVGDMWTVTAVAAITDPEGTGQTLQPGDEVVWDGTQWTIIGNALLPNVEAALLNVLSADEDMLLRQSGALGRLAVGSIGQILQVIDLGGAVPGVSWGAPLPTAPKEVVDESATPSPLVIAPPHINNIVLVGPGPYTVVLPDPATLTTGDEIHLRHSSAIVVGGGPPSWPILLDLGAGAGTLEGVASGGLGLPITYVPGPTQYAGGITLRVTEPAGGGLQDWKIVGDWAIVV